MSILGNILSRITGGRPSRPSEAATSKPPAMSAMGKAAMPRPGTASPARVSTTAPPSQPPVAAGDPIPRAGDLLEAVDVERHLDALAAKSPQKLDWRHSIVDMMKLLCMDSSLQERKALARELGYPGELGDSARMNLWLHQEVLRQIAHSGGKVPQDLLH